MRRVIKIYKGDKYIFGAQIIGENCGYDQFGVFHCTCGHCIPLRIDVRQDREYSGNYCCGGRNHGDNDSDNKSTFLRASI